MPENTGMHTSQLHIEQSAGGAWYVVGKLGYIVDGPYWFRADALAALERVAWRAEVAS